VKYIIVINDEAHHGIWSWNLIFNPSELRIVIEKYATLEVSTNELAKCPKCGKKVKGHVDIEKYFGYRNMNGIMKP